MLTTGTHRLENQVPLKSIHPLPNGRRPKSR
jgi:hypothetical protein